MPTPKVLPDYLRYYDTVELRESDECPTCDEPSRLTQIRLDLRGLIRFYSCPRCGRWLHISSSDLPN